jgi:hypothetical protein
MMYGLLAPEDKQQALFQGLGGLGMGLLAGSAPSTTPKGLLGGVGQGLAGFNQGMQGHVQNVQRNKMAEVQMADLEQRRNENKARQDALANLPPEEQMAALLGGDAYWSSKFSTPKQTPAMLNAAAMGYKPGTPEYQGYLASVTQPSKDGRTSAQKNAEALGFKPGTQPYIEYVRAATVKPAKPDEPFGSSLTGRMYDIWQQGPENPNYGLAVAHLSKPQMIQGPEGVMTMPAVLTADGKLNAGGQAAPTTIEGTQKFNEAQVKAAGFANRAVNASTQILDMESQGYSPASFGEGVVGEVSNYTASPQYQKYKQAAWEWMAAALRDESGAAIPDTEMDKYYRIYFPQPGDGKEVQVQKAQSRKALELGMVAKSGGAYEKMFAGSSSGLHTGVGGGGGGNVPAMEGLSDEDIMRGAGLVD